MPLPTQTGIPKIGLAVWNALVAFVNGLEAAIAQKASSGDLAAHVGSTAAHGATSSPTPSTPVRRDAGGGTSLTALALTGTNPNAGHAVRRDWVEAFVAGALETSTGTTPPGEEPAAGGDPAASIVARDAFERTVADGWGTANSGGDWIATPGATSVSEGSAVMRLDGPNTYAQARLPGSKATDLIAQFTTWSATPGKLPGGSGAFQLLRVRIADNADEYRLKGQWTSNGDLITWWTKSVSGVEADISAKTTAAFKYAPGVKVVWKGSATGAYPTLLRSKVWLADTSEPTGWSEQFTDDSPSIQTPGHVGTFVQLSGGTTNGPFEWRVDGFSVEGTLSQVEPQPAPTERRWATDYASATTVASQWKALQLPRVRGVLQPDRSRLVKGAAVPGTGPYKPAAAAVFELRPYNASNIQVTATAAASASSSVISMSSGNVAALRPLDFMRSDRTGEMLRVVSASGTTVTVERGRPNTSAQPINAGDTFTVPGGDVNDSGGSYATSRIEALADYPTPWSTPIGDWPSAPGTVQWYGYEFLFPEAFPFRTNSDWLTITQWKGYRGGGPPLALELNRDQLRFGGSYGGNGSAYTALGGAQAGTWRRIEVGIKYAADSSGWVEVWLDGVNVISRRAQQTMEVVNGSPDPVYLKQGIYRTAGWPVTTEVLFGDVFIGSTRAAVLPGA